MTILGANFFQNTNIFLHLLKSVKNKHTLFELVSRGSVHQHTTGEQLRYGRETWLSTMERTSTSSKMQSQSKNTKKIINKYKKGLAKLKT